MGKSTKLSLAVAALILGTSLVACDDGRGGAEAAARQLASAVSGLDVGGVAFDGKDAAAANEQLKNVFASLDPAKPTVEAGDITLDGENASVPLTYSWKIADSDWKYTTSAAFRKSGDKWLTVWNPASLVPDLNDSEILTKGTRSPQRADILGAGDAPLVTYRPVVNVGIDKPQLGAADPADSAAKLAALVGVDPAATRSRSRPRAQKRSFPPSPCAKKAAPSPTNRLLPSPVPVPFRTRCRSRPPGPSPGPCSGPSARQPPSRSKPREAS